MACWVPSRRGRKKVRARFADLLVEAGQAFDEAKTFEGEKQIALHQRSAKSVSERETQIWNRHHVPPRNPARFTPPRTILVKREDHEAYNTLFKNAGTLKQCIEILKRDWWPASGGQRVKQALDEWLDIDTKSGQ